MEDRKRTREKRSTTPRSGMKGGVTRNGSEKMSFLAQERPRKLQGKRRTNYDQKRCVKKILGKWNESERENQEVGATEME